MLPCGVGIVLAAPCDKIDTISMMHVLSVFNYHTILPSPSRSEVFDINFGSLVEEGRFRSHHVSRSCRVTRPGYWDYSLLRAQFGALYVDMPDQQDFDEDRGEKRLNILYP